MTAKMTLPMAVMPSVISQSVADVLKVHGLTLTPDLLDEIGKNATQCLYALDESDPFAPEQPSLRDRLSCGETLRALAMTAVFPNGEIAEVLTRVGDWLAKTTRAELEAAKKGGKAA